MRRLVFRCSCVTLDYPKYRLQEILDNSREIVRGTWIKKVSHTHLKSLEKELGYEVNKRSGLTMKDDGYVQYYKSFYDNGKNIVPVYFFKQSSIEYFFE